MKYKVAVIRLCFVVKRLNYITANSFAIFIGIIIIKLRIYHYQLDLKSIAFIRLRPPREHTTQIGLKTLGGIRIVLSSEIKHLLSSLRLVYYFISNFLPVRLTFSLTPRSLAMHLNRSREWQLIFSLVPKRHSFSKML